MPTPPSKKEFAKIIDDLQEAIDVDASDGRSVPINMNFVDLGFLTKDQGFIPAGSFEEIRCHSPFVYEKKNGTKYILRARGTKLQLYNQISRTWADIVESPTFTAEAEFGYFVYDDVLHLGNGVESLYTFDGLLFTEYASAPKGNLLEVFEDRLFISGVSSEPLTVYYSNVGTPTTFTPTDVIKPLGTDHVTNLKNYYGSLLIFKKETIWKITFIYDQIAAAFVPKLEAQSGAYGACSKKGVVWVENDLWFFTGQEVRAIGITDNITGALGINKTVISDDIKETLKTMEVSNQSKSVVFYFKRRFYLGIPLNSEYNNTLFVAHTLYKNSWTKYTERYKSNIDNFMIVDDTLYSSTSSSPYGIIKWIVEDEDKLDVNYSLSTES